jgi:NADPH:quinone reductase-like Zn-dependent oxidoreductase
MQAIVRTRYGSPDVLQLIEVEKPVPHDGEVLIRVHAASVNATDWHAMRGKPFLNRTRGNGWRTPKDPRLGVDVAGRVEAVGTNVTQFQVGDEVFGRRRGAFAEYVCAREAAVVVKPANLSFEEAAAVPLAALTALGALRDTGRIQPGQQVLIQGASGGVGTFAVQLAKAFGAEVTAVCSPRSLEMALSLGADHVIDYTHVDFTKGRRKTRRRYDLILAVNGYHPIFGYRRALRPNGRFVLVCASKRPLRALFQAMLLGPAISRMGSKKMGFFVAHPTQQDLVVVKELLEAGTVVPVIERRYPLSATAEAVRYLEVGHARGKVVITLCDVSHREERVERGVTARGD